MILAQDGHAPSTKIEAGLDSGYLDGVILSIKKRKPENIAQVISTLLNRNNPPEVFLDTHFYASDKKMSRPGYIDEYHLYDDEMTKKDFTPKRIVNISRQHIDYQRSIGLKNLIVPSLMISNFNDYRSFLSFQFYESSLDYVREIGGRGCKTYLTLALRENALKDIENLSSFLDDITMYTDTAGFYIVIERDNASNPQWQDSVTLSKLMYIIQALSGSFEVVCGFTDFSGLPLLASGATHIGSGWSQTLRQLTATYFMRTRGSNNGKFRYASKELLTQLISVPDLQTIISHGLSSKYIDTVHNEGLTDSENLIQNRISLILHQWKVYQELGKRIKGSADPLSELELIIEDARANLLELRSNQIVLKPGSVDHYDVWSRAIHDLRAGVL